MCNDLLEVLEEHLKRKANNHQINIEELGWYYDPLSEEHIAYYNNKLQLNAIQRAVSQVIATNDMQSLLKPL